MNKRFFYCILIFFTAFTSHAPSQGLMEKTVLEELYRRDSLSLNYNSPLYTYYVESISAGMLDTSIIVSGIKFIFLPKSGILNIMKHHKHHKFQIIRLRITSIENSMINYRVTSGSSLYKFYKNFNQLFMNSIINISLIYNCEKEQFEVKRRVPN